MDHQNATGWLGPDDGFGGRGNTYWTGWNVAASLLQYADAKGIVRFSYPYSSRNSIDLYVN